jgi:hypothetical protein
MTGSREPTLVTDGERVDGPDSHRLRVMESTLRESGIPPARSRIISDGTLGMEGEDLLQLTLADNTRIEANLNLLVRSLQHLTAGAVAARDANSAIAIELEGLRELLDRSHAQEMALKHRIRSLEHLMETERRDTQRERTYFIEQEDAFLADLLSDHARELESLKNKLAKALASMEETMQARRDSVERRFVTSPTEPSMRAAESPAEIALVKLKTVRIPRPSEPADVAPVSSAASTPVASGPASAPPTSASAANGTKPALKQKPEASSRPLVGYALGSGDVAEEHIEAAGARPPAT